MINPSQLIVRKIKYLANLFGLDIVRAKNSPKLTMLGLRNFDFRTIIDVGANTGQFAKKISSIFPNATIFCFEPMSQPFEILKTWADSKNNNIIPINLAVGDKKGEEQMFFHEDHSPSSSLLPTTKLSEQIYPMLKKQKPVIVETTTLDTFFEEETVELSPAILVKLDVQGYENRVIRGGNNILSLASACILEISLDSLYSGQAQFNDLLIKLDNLNYKYGGNLGQSFAKDGHCVFVDAVFVKKNIVWRFT